MYIKYKLFSFHKSGFSIVKFVADRFGKVIDPKIVKFSGKAFDELALNKLNNIRYLMLPSSYIHQI